MSKNDKTAAGTHAFSIGQTVRMKTRSSVCAPETFEIIRRLPLEGTVPKYRVKSFIEQHERVIAQDLIEAVESSPSEADDRLVQHTFKDFITINTSTRAKNQRGPWARK